MKMDFLVTSVEFLFPKIYSEDLTVFLIICVLFLPCLPVMWFYDVFVGFFLVILVNIYTICMP